MSISTEQTQALRALLANNPALQARLQQSGGPADAAALLSRAASEAGMTVDEAALREHFEQSTAQAQTDALSDEQLAAVAAGGMDRWSPLRSLLVLDPFSGC